MGAFWSGDVLCMQDKPHLEKKEYNFFSVHLKCIYIIISYNISCISILFPNFAPCIFHLCNHTVFAFILVFGYQAAQDEVISLRHRCEALQAGSYPENFPMLGDRLHQLKPVFFFGGFCFFFVPLFFIDVDWELNSCFKNFSGW